MIGFFVTLSDENKILTFGVSINNTNTYCFIVGTLNFQCTCHHFLFKYMVLDKCQQNAYIAL